MEPATTDATTSLCPIGRYPSRTLAEEHGLVVLAMDHPCWILNPSPGEERYQLAVEAGDAPGAYAEIQAYEQELLEAADPPGLELPGFPAGRWFAFLYAAVLLLGYGYQNGHPDAESRFLSDNLAIIDGGETFRAATALLLHADSFHLLGNVLFGLLFGLLVACSVGARTGWVLILLSGFLGNLINAHHYYPALHRSLGASTAVFGALGILTGYGLIAAFLSPKSAPWARAILPIAGGIVLLAWFGLGGPEVDVMAHIYGFAIGVPLGFFTGCTRILLGNRHRPATAPQT